METLPSAFTRIRRGAEGRWAVSRPAESTEHRAMTRRMVGNATRRAHVHAIRPVRLWRNPVHLWPIVGLLGVLFVRILLVPSPSVAYRSEREVARRVLSVSGSANSLICPATPEKSGVREENPCRSTS